MEVYLGLVVGTLVATVLLPFATSEFYRRGQHGIGRLRGRRGTGKIELEAP